MNVLNISGYKFLPLYDRYHLKIWLRQLCKGLGIKGTITLSPEGINIGVAGQEEAVRAFIKLFNAEPRFADIEFKESFSETIPFRRFVVKVKGHIVPALIDVDARDSAGHNLSPQQLKEWLDRDEDIILIDTRNDYEIEYGTFTKAKHFGLKQFSQIKTEFEKMAKQARNKKVVMFCTGGIRCEKGIPLAKESGLENVYQLEGGILKYFEECGGEHYQGGCFVFDRRISVDPNLQPLNKGDRETQA